LTLIEFNNYNKEIYNKAITNIIRQNKLFVKIAYQNKFLKFGK